ncbi:MAG: hypothetical protein ACFFDT_09935 [Candidatus Hodarchaeota archaeon]
MVQTQAPTVEDEDVTTYSTRIGISIILSFGIMLTIVSFGFISVGYFVYQILGIPGIPINLLTIALAVFGAVIGTYFYHTRYVRRELTMNSEGFALKIGRRLYEYSWSDFSVVALSVSFSHYGAKGYIIKLYVDDLEGEYVDLPIYHFSKSIDIFSLRKEVEEKVRLAQKVTLSNSKKQTS